MFARVSSIQIRQPTGQWAESTNQANVLSEIYRITVPREEVWALDPTRPFVFIPLARRAWTPAGIGTQTYTSAATVGLAQLINAADGDCAYGLPNREAIYLDSADTLRTITAHAPGPTGTITISDASAEAHTVFAPASTDGYIEIRIEDPRGLGKVSYSIAAYNTRPAIIFNMWRGTTAMGLSAPFMLPEDFDIVFYLKAAWTIGWGTPLNNAIPAQNNLHLPVKILARSSFDAGLEARIREQMVTLAR